MTKELRRLSILVLVMFLALFGSTTIIQALEADNLAENPNNTRARYDSYEIQRGAIIASGTAIASSVPSDDLYSFQRVYTDSPLWSNVTGYYNPVLGASSGLESAMNTELSGLGSTNVLNRLDQILSGQSARGNSVEISLDATVQQAAYDALGDQQGAVVAIEPKTGRVLAMVTSPGYDANAIATHDTHAANSAYDALAADDADPLFNRAIGGDLNAPGSTFKLVVAAAALSTDGYTTASELPNPATYQLKDSTSVVHNASGGTCGPGATVTIAEALRLSCNVPMAELAEKLGDEVIRKTAEKFGFNTALEIPLSVSASLYPKTITDDAQTALSGFGQGQVEATPLQIAMVSAAIANGGVVMKPTMVDDVLAPDLSVLQSTSPSEQSTAVSADVAKSLTQMMVANVSSGVASGARIDGVDVAGKTGTAENGGSNPFSLWFTGFAPADDPQIAVAVVVENGGGLGQSGSGDAIAAPIAKKVMEAVLNK